MAREVEPTEEIIQAARAQYADRELILLESQTYSVVAVIPNTMEYNRFRNGSKNDATRTEAFLTLVSNAIVWPDKKKVLEIIGKRPLMLETWYKQLENAAGGEEEAVVKKL